MLLVSVKTTMLCVYAFIAILFIIAIIKAIIGRGKLGEYSVSRRLKKLPKEEFIVLNDITIKEGGRTSQIDHIVVSNYGIFVIETKNYQGLIYGGEDAQYWTQNIFGHKFKMYNPIKQNEGHIRALKRMTAEIGDLPFISIIAFSKRANISVSSEKAYIMYYMDVAPFINSFYEYKIHQTDIDKFLECISQKKVEGKQEATNHKEYASKIRKRNESAINNGYCPRCGGKLTLRKGRYGEFWGCSNYPKCKFTMKKEDYEG